VAPTNTPTATPLLPYSLIRRHLLPSLAPPTTVSPPPSSADHRAHKTTGTQPSRATAPLLCAQPSSSLTDTRAKPCRKPSALPMSRPRRSLVGRATVTPAPSASTQSCSPNPLNQTGLAMAWHHKNATTRPCLCTRLASHLCVEPNNNDAELRHLRESYPIIGARARSVASTTFPASTSIVSTMPLEPPRPCPHLQGRDNIHRATILALPQLCSLSSEPHMAPPEDLCTGEPPAHQALPNFSFPSILTLSMLRSALVPPLHIPAGRLQPHSVPVHKPYIAANLVDHHVEPTFVSCLCPAFVP
jgi:hypothetical protein